MHILLDPNSTIKNHLGKSLKALIPELGYTLFKPSKKKNPQEYDLLILDGHISDIDKGYLAALALAEKKPIVCLVPKGFPIPEVFEQLQSAKEYAKLFHLAFFSEDSINDVLNKMLKQFVPEKKEKPSIKFTLRITPTMERYLESLAKQDQVSKADYLRKLIDNEIKK
jgi:predicted HicB family RNase H-like nuclease